MVLMSEWVYANGDRQQEGATGSLLFYWEGSFFLPKSPFWQLCELHEDGMSIVEPLHCGSEQMGL